jgi:hypothetical protein
MSKAGGQVVQNSRPYKVDGEVGRFTFLTHSILNDTDIQYDTGRDIFLYLHGKEYSQKRHLYPRTSAFHAAR